MCDPITIAGIALTAGSYAANQVAQSRVDKARSNAMTAERTRQKGLDQEAASLNAASQDTYKDFGTKEAAKAQSLSDVYAANEVASPSPSDIPAPTSNIVVDEQAKQDAKTAAYGKQQGDALAHMRAFGDVLGDNSLVQARNASQIGQIGGFKRGSSDVLSYELDAANHKGDALKSLGDILGGLGSIGVSAGLGGGSFGNIAASAAKPVLGPPMSAMPQRMIAAPIRFRGLM